MGVLTVGKPLTWDEIQAVKLDYLSWCVSDLCDQYTQGKDNTASPGWLGEEIEYCLIPTNPSNDPISVPNLIQTLTQDNVRARRTN